MVINYVGTRVLTTITITTTSQVAVPLLEILGVLVLEVLGVPWVLEVPLVQLHV